MIILFSIIGGSIFIYGVHRTIKNRRKRRRYSLVFSQQKNNKMAIVSSITLTSLVAEVLTLSVVDQNNNNAVIPGTLSAISVASSDATQVTAAVDATTAGGVDVDAVSQTGGATVTATATFASTKLQADGVTPVVSGTFTAILTVVNNVVVKAALVFNQ